MLLWILECMYLFILFSCMLRSEILCGMVVLLAFWGTSLLFSIVTAPICNTIYLVLGLPFLCKCQHWLFLDFLMIAILTSIRWYLWFQFGFLWWLVMLNIFSYACLPPLYMYSITMCTHVCVCEILHWNLCNSLMTGWIEKLS